MNMMHRSGIYDMVGEQGFYWSVERALLDLRPYTGKSNNAQGVCLRHTPFYCEYYTNSFHVLMQYTEIAYCVFLKCAIIIS